MKNRIFLIFFCLALVSGCAKETNATINVGCPISIIVISNEKGYESDIYNQSVKNAFENFRIENNYSENCFDYVSAFDSTKYQDTINSAIFIEPDLIVVANSEMKEDLTKAIEDEVNQKIVYLGNDANSFNILNVSIDSYDAGYIYGSLIGLNNNSLNFSSYGFLGNNQNLNDGFKNGLEDYSGYLSQIVPTVEEVAKINDNFKMVDYFIDNNTSVIIVENPNDLAMTLDKVSNSGKNIYVVANNLVYKSVELLGEYQDYLLLSISNNYELVINSVIEMIDSGSFKGGIINTFYNSISNDGLLITRNDDLISLESIQTIEEYIKNNKLIRRNENESN